MTNDCSILSSVDAKSKPARPLFVDDAPPLSSSVSDNPSAARTAPSTWLMRPNDTAAVRASYLLGTGTPRASKSIPRSSADASLTSVTSTCADVLHHRSIRQFHGRDDEIIPKRRSIFFYSSTTARSIDHLAASPLAPRDVVLARLFRPAKTDNYVRSPPPLRTASAS